MGITDLSPAHDQVYTPHCPALSAGAAMYVFSVTCGQMSAHVLVPCTMAFFTSQS